MVVLRLAVNPIKTLRFAFVGKISLALTAAFAKVLCLE